MCKGLIIYLQIKIRFVHTQCSALKNNRKFQKTLRFKEIMHRFGNEVAIKPITGTPHYKE